MKGMCAKEPAVSFCTLLPKIYFFPSKSVEICAIIVYRNRARFVLRSRDFTAEAGAFFFKVLYRKRRTGRHKMYQIGNIVVYGIEGMADKRFIDIFRFYA